MHIKNDFAGKNGALGLQPQTGNAIYFLLYILKQNLSRM